MAGSLTDPRFLYRAIGFMQGAAFGAYGLSALVWWAVDLELSPLRLVVLGTIMEVAVLLSESPTGVVADVFSRKWSIVASWLIMGVSQMLSPISPLLPVLLIWQALWGFGYTFQSGADTAWVTDEIGTADDSLVMSRAVASSVGLVFGLAAAIGLTQWSLPGTMIVSGAIAVLFGLSLAVVMPETNFTPADRTDRSTGAAMIDTWRRGFVSVRRIRVLRILMVATLVVAMADETVDRLDFVRMKELGFPDLDGGDSAALFGAVWIFMTLLTIPMMLWFARSSAESSDRRSAVLMTTLLGFGAVGVGLMAGNIFVLALIGWVMRDVLREVISPLGEAWFNRHAESDIRATVISFRTQSMAFGEIFGGLCLGLVAEVITLQMAFVGAAALLGLAAVQVGRLLRRGPMVAAPGSVNT